MKQQNTKTTNKKHLIMALVFSFIVAFLLFVYEPILMYSGNIDEFWFDLETLIGAMLLPFLATFFVLGAFYAVAFLMTRKKSKIFYFIEIVSYSGFVYLYIHGNFLAGMLPSLYGGAIDWWGGDLIVGHIISAVLLLAVVGLIIFGVKKLSSTETAKYAFYVTAATSAMMLVSFISAFTTPGIFVNKDIQPVATIKNINKISSNQNFYILTVDCTDSDVFNDFVSEKYSDDFKDFTYYKDAASGYSSTRNSIPLIFSGQFYKNQMEFNKFSTQALDSSKAFEQIKKSGYDMNFYNNDFVWNSKKSQIFSNFVNNLSNYHQGRFIAQELKYTMYKYLPFALKSFSKVESMDFAATINTDNIDGLYDWKNLWYYNNVLSKDPEMTEDKLFQYVHIQGSHSPYDMDEDLTPIPDESGTYEQKVGASAKIASLAIERLKKAGAYDNSTIVIMSDHGWHDHVPVLYVKGINETHSKMHVSDKQVSWTDLDEAFAELAVGATANELFEDIPTEGRTRYFYVDFEKIPMKESINYGGKSYDSSAWQTGEEYPVYRAQ